ncbi:MAG: YcxB family protein [Candidatus Izemoplasmatales bacterium]|nr:YcxB family protein [Candidatus Izemoplasmatales bacterium]
MVKNFIIITVISLGFTIYMMTQGEWAYAALLVGILAAYFILTLGMQKLTTNRMLKRSPLVENPMLQTYIFKDEEFDVTNVKSYAVNYNNVQNIKIAPDFYMIQTNDRKTYIIDFKGFETDEDKVELGKFFVERFSLKVK